MLIFKYLHAKAQIKWSLSNLVAMLRFNLLSYKDLWYWLDHPYYSPPPEQELVQMSLVY